MKKKLWILIIFLIATLNLLDGLLTIHAIKRGRVELNPLMRYALDNNFFIEYKVVASVLICLAYLTIDSTLVRKILLGILTLLFLVFLYHMIL